jgi:hypothetical protein
MAFKVKITVVAMLGDTEKFPCHFGYNIGDEILYDGEKFEGRVCPALIADTDLMKNVRDLYLLGPRHKNPWWVHPMWYAPGSISDPSKAKYDGRGYQSIFEDRSESGYHMANLLPQEAWTWPPHPERNIAKEVTVTCPDVRTATVFHLEAVDLVDCGYDIVFFRRNMSVLGKILQKPEGVMMDKIIDEFSEEEIMEVYPTLSQQIIVPFVEQLQVMEFVTVENNLVKGTEKGRTRLEEHIKSLSKEEQDAVNLHPELINAIEIH